MTSKVPGELKVSGYFWKHLGGYCAAAGLRIQFEYNQTPGIHFKVEPPEEYGQWILKGLQDGMALRFPEFPPTGSIWITEIQADPVDSSPRAFYQAGRMVIDQALSLIESWEAAVSL